MPYWQWYKKYQWVEIRVERREKDPRPESFSPIGEIEPLGQPIDTSDNWAKRKQYVFAKGISTMCELQRKSQREVSLGIIRPGVVEDFTIEKTEREFDKQYLDRMRQRDMFQADRRPLEKILYKFSYKFKCEEPGCRGHKQMITDWEIGRLYLRMRDQYQDEGIACDKVKKKFYDTICAADKDTHFFVGTTLQHGTWLVIGTFWPKKPDDLQQPELPNILSS